MIIINNFAQYGLNKRRNFMQAPKDEDGNPSYIIVDSIEDFCIAMVQECECPDCAVFVVRIDNSMLAFVKEDDGVAVYGGNDHNFFSIVDGETRRCCYGLIIEEEENKWMIQE